MENQKIDRFGRELLFLVDNSETSQQHKRSKKSYTNEALGILYD